MDSRARPGSRGAHVRRGAAPILRLLFFCSAILGASQRGAGSSSTSHATLLLCSGCAEGPNNWAPGRK